MINVIIVEDENIVRLGLSAMLDWEAHGFHLSGMFKNGKEAFDFLQKNPVDVVITDIRMPVMDGEELVRKIRESGNSVEIVILSNFDDFEIVKNCFKMGISDYVLKQNIEPEAFLELLGNIVDKRKHASVKEEKREELQDGQNFWGELREFDFQINHPEIQQNFQDQIQEFTAKRFCVAELSFFHERDGKLYVGQNPRNSVVVESLKGCGIHFFDGVEVFRTGDKYAVLLWYGAQENEIEKKIYQWMHRICLMAKEYFNLEVKIGVSDLDVKLECLKASYERAKRSRTWLFYYPDRKYFMYESRLDYFREETDFFKCSREVRLCLEFNNFSVLKESLVNFYDELKREKNVCPDNICQFTNSILHDINYFLSENTEIKLQDLQEDWEQYTKSYDVTIDSLKAFLLGVVEQVIHYLKSYEKNYEIVARVKRIISKQYKEELSLQYLADVLNVNPVYLSTLFKKKTGIAYIQYLTNYRIKKAVELLRTTNYSVEEIAEEVGYANANYFVKVFKKTMGMTVSDFRKKGI